MAGTTTRIYPQLVGELLQQVLRDARPQPPRRDRSRQQVARIARRLRERRRRSLAAKESPGPGSA
jgi:hypothetical protein